MGARALRAYERSSDFVLAHSRLSLVAILAITAASVSLYLALPKGFMPTQDTGLLYLRTYSDPPNISFGALEDQQRIVGETILKDPAVSTLISFVGGSGRSPDAGDMVIALKPMDQRKISIQDVTSRLRDTLSKVSQLRYFFFPIQDLNLGVQQGSRYQFGVWGTNLSQVLGAGNVMVRRIRALKEVTDVVPNWESSGLQAGVEINRMRAATMGVSAAAIDDVLHDAFSQAQIKRLYQLTNFSFVVLEVESDNKPGVGILDRLYVQNAGGGQVPLSA